MIGDDKMDFIKSEKQKEKPKEIDEEIVEKILEQPDRFAALFSIFSKLPQDLTIWFIGMVKNRFSTKGYAEVDLTQAVNMGMDALPGDIIIRKNRDPKLSDIVEIGGRDKDAYFTQTVKVVKINFKEGTLFVKSPLQEDVNGLVSINNIICVIDKVIKYGDSDWEKITKTLDIEYDTREVAEWVEKSLEHVKNVDFYDKERTIKKLEERLRVINGK